jgi:tripartite-type tricarboxylate transporter receptor subunit TctC
MLTRRSVAVLTVASALCPRLSAQGYPAKPIRLVVGFAPGSTTDLVARVLGEELGRVLGQGAMVENVAGDLGRRAAELVAASPPDGYTLLLAGAEISGAKQARKTLLPVARVGIAPQVLVVKAGSGRIKSPADVPKLSPRIAAAGLFSQYLATQTPSAVWVPARASFASIESLLDGLADAAIVPLAIAKMPQFAGQLRILAVAGSEGIPELDAPTMKEAGLLDKPLDPFIGVFGQAAMPKDAVRLLSDVVGKVSSAKGWERLKEAGAFYPRAMPTEAFTVRLSQVSASLCDDIAYCEKTPECGRPC